MNAPLSALDQRFAALRASLADAAPPPATDHAIATAVARAGRRGVGSARFAAHPAVRRHGWIAWPLALAAAVTVISFVTRALAPNATPDAPPRHAAAAPASFMPVVPLAELERAGDALVVPARLPRMSLAQFGLPVNPALAADAIDTELLVRSDGAVLAVRFVD